MIDEGSGANCSCLATLWPAPRPEPFGGLLPLAPVVPAGHLTSLSAPTLDLNSAEESDRKVVKPFVVPEESDRWTTVILVEGRFMPGLRALIFGSFQVVTFLRKMSAAVLPSSLRPFCSPGTLYEIVIPPKNIGICSGLPLVSVL